MASISYKNTLQEYYQKNGGVLPKYTSRQVGGPPHAPLWQSKVETEIGIFEGIIADSKTRAENSAAEFALYILDTTKVKKEKPNIRFSDRTVILVDVENKQKFIDHLASKYDLDENTDIVAFCVTKTMQLLSKYSNEVKRVIVDSSRNDAADVAMILYVGKLIGEHKYNRIIVVTADHFGDSLVDCIRSGVIYPPFEKIYTVVNTEGLEKIIESVPPKDLITP
jgi:hypothetical protein